MKNRIPSGIEGLDEIIEGGFPKPSLIILAGNPGVGKTVFSSQFLAKGLMLKESCVYTSFAENKKEFFKNSLKHLEFDFSKYESESKFKFLDFLTFKEEIGLSSCLKIMLEEINSIKAKRLVIDSFSAMAQAFEKPIDARAFIHTIFNKIVKQLGCTSMLIEEIPLGESRLGLGIEEFIADCVILLRAKELEGRLLRDLEVVKLKGTELKEKKLVFTLKNGFKAFQAFKPKPIEKPKRFQPIQDMPDKYSTGSEDFDSMLNGGIPKGSIMLLELDEKVSTLEYHLFIVPMAANFMLQGRGVIVVPSSGIDPALLHRYVEIYGGTEEEWRRYARIIVARSFLEGEAWPNVIMVRGEEWMEDLNKFVEVAEKLMAETGNPNLSIIGIDTLITLHGKRNCEKILNLTATRARKVKAIFIAIVKAGYRDLAIKLSPIADVYLRLTREHGCLLLYGIKPRTCLYAVEMDVSKGYPLPKLIPIV